MVVSAAHFKDVVNGYEKRTDGLWVHRGTLLVNSMRRTDDVGWITPGFENAYTSYSSPFAVAYRKMPDGRVILRGLIMAGTQAATAFTLPAGYRPAATMHGQYLFLQAAQGGIYRCDVQATGQVLICVEVKGGAWQAGGWTSLDGMSFLAEA